MSKSNSLPKRTAGNKWLETINPINQISISEAKSIYDAARRHGSPRLQKIYDEIELTDPVLMTCVERRQAALAGLGWQVRTRASEDADLAEQQRVAADKFLAGIDNLTDAICHLDLAFFRGYSHVQPLWDSEDGSSATIPSVHHINLLNNWNFLQDEEGTFLWNPNCSNDPRECVAITPDARLISVTRRRAIDWPALAIYIRKSLGERDWGRFIERYGIPPVDVVMAPNATDTQRDDYLASAESARDGLPTAWPSGSVVSRAEGSRGQDPFTAFIEHQEKLIVLAATGGTLTSLAQADTGALAGGAQMDVWREIVLRDALVIADAIERALLRPFIEATFPGQPFAIAFEMGVERKSTAKELADLAGALKTAGYIVKKEELEAVIGFTLERDPIAELGLGVDPSTSPGRFSLARASASSDRATAPGRLDDLLAAFKTDNKPLATAIEALLKDLEDAREDGQSATGLSDFLASLPSLIPDDPAMAAVLAEEMAKEFSKTANPPA